MDGCYWECQSDRCYHLRVKVPMDFFQKERDGVVNTSIDEGVKLCQDWDVEMEKRRPKKKTMPGELCKDERLKLKDEISRAMKNTIDRLHSEINGRFERLMDMDSKFVFLLDIKSLFMKM